MGWFILVLFEVLERERKGMKSAENNQAENRLVLSKYQFGIFTTEQLGLKLAREVEEICLQQYKLDAPVHSNSSLSGGQAWVE